jgi:hypothetical protein
MPLSVDGRQAKAISRKYPTKLIKNARFRQLPELSPPLFTQVIGEGPRLKVTGWVPLREKRGSGKGG